MAILLGLAVSKCPRARRARIYTRSCHTPPRTRSHAHVPVLRAPRALGQPPVLAPLTPPRMLAAADGGRVQLRPEASRWYGSESNGVENTFEF